MAKQLSIGSIPFYNGDNTEQTKEVANILLSFKSSKEWMKLWVCIRYVK